MLRSRAFPEAADASAADDEPSFSALFPRGIIEQEFPVGPDDGNRAYFGRDVLRGLIEGIDDFGPNVSNVGDDIAPLRRCWVQRLG